MNTGKMKTKGNFLASAKISNKHPFLKVKVVGTYSKIYGTRENVTKCIGLVYSRVIKMDNRCEMNTYF